MSSKPNFIIFMTDTQGANVTGCYGAEGVKTPNIDALAKAGVRFDRAYTTAPLCTPARAGLFTGVYSNNSGPWSNSIPLYENNKSMADHMGDMGYACAYSGKWHLSGHDYFDTGHPARGWDPKVWFDGKNYLDTLTPAEKERWRQAVPDIKTTPRSDITDTFTWAHHISDRGIDFLKEHDEQPFCMVLSYDEPHHPWASPASFTEPYLDYEFPLGPSFHDDLKDKPSHHREWAEVIKNLPPEHLPLRGDGFFLPSYFGCLSYVDHEIGRVIKALEGSPYNDNTYIIFTSDHGDQMGQHQLMSKGPCMYEASTRIPFIVRPPQGSSPNDHVNDTPVSHADILPTMMKLAGGEAPEIMAGEDISPLIQGEHQKDKKVVIEFNRFEIGHDSAGGFQPIRCIVERGHKLVINLLTEDELYNLDDDPHEMVNLIHDPSKAELRKEMHLHLLEWMNRNRDPFRGSKWDRRPWGTSLGMEWQGPYRPRLNDGYWPSELSYATGEPLSEVD